MFLHAGCSVVVVVAVLSEIFRSKEQNVYALYASQTPKRQLNRRIEPVYICLLICLLNLNFATRFGGKCVSGCLEWENCRNDASA